MDTYVTDTAHSLELARNKIRCFQYLTKKNVPFPKTGSAFATEGYKKILNTIGGEPFIIKLNEGTQGVGVFLAQDESQAENFLNTFDQLDTEVMLQEFIEEAAGTDLRCFVVDGEVVASMRRESQNDDFRANISLGGHAYEANLTEEERDVALRAAAAVNLNVSGVDIVRSKRGPLVIEINGAPDFTGEWGLENVSGVDVASAIIDFAIKGKERFDKGEGVWLDTWS
jgi:ribosomal protein S6--L-glutamate ligase